MAKYRLLRVVLMRSSSIFNKHLSHVFAILQTNGFCAAKELLRPKLAHLRTEVIFRCRVKITNAALLRSKTVSHERDISSAMNNHKYTVQSWQAMKVYLTHKIGYKSITHDSKHQIDDMKMDDSTRKASVSGIQIIAHEFVEMLPSASNLRNHD